MHFRFELDQRLYYNLLVGINDCVPKDEYYCWAVVPRQLIAILHRGLGIHVHDDASSQNAVQKHWSLCM